MTDFVQCKEWGRPPAHPVAMVRAIDQERSSHAPWKHLQPDHLDARLDDGKEASFDSPDELAAWLERHADVEPRAIFLRWTEGGRPAAPGMARIATRIGNPTTLWVGCQDEAASIGMFQLLLSAIDHSTSANGKQADLPLANCYGLGVESRHGVSVRPVASRSSPYARQVPLITAESTQKRLFSRLMNNPWTVGIGTAVIAGLILLVLTWFVEPG